jgi:hypothetical protein
MALTASQYRATRFSLRPGGKFVPREFALEAIKSGWLVPCDGDLFGDPNNAQTWTARILTEEELWALASLQDPCSASTHPSAKESDMDMREFLKATYITIAELNTGGGIPEASVAGAERGKKFDKPVLRLEVNGMPRLVGLNKKSLANLCRAWGAESDDWVGRKVSVDIGPSPFGDDDSVDSIIVEPLPETVEAEEEEVDPPSAPSKKRSPKAAVSSTFEKPIDDEIPFCPQTD